MAYIQKNLPDIKNIFLLKANPWYVSRLILKIYIVIFVLALSFFAGSPDDILWRVVNTLDTLLFYFTLILLPFIPLNLKNGDKKEKIKSILVLVIIVFAAKYFYMI